MGVNPQLNALQKEVTRERILESGSRIFAEKPIDKVTMSDVADTAGIGVATVYRYYANKTALALAISAWMWGRYVDPVIRRAETSELTAAEELELFLDTFLDLYRNHKEMLRFNLFFNVYIVNEDVPPEVMKPYKDVVDRMEQHFRVIYDKALRDHTLRTDISSREIFYTSLHLMLAAVTRYAGGLVFGGGVDPEKELLLQRDMLLREFLQAQ